MCGGANGLVVHLFWNKRPCEGTIAAGLRLLGAKQLRMTGDTCSFTPSRQSSRRDVRSAGYRSCRCRWGGIDRRIVWSVDVQLTTGRSLARVLTYRSLPPMPPGRVEAKYSVLPVADNAGKLSAAGEFTVGAEVLRRRPGLRHVITLRHVQVLIPIARRAEDNLQTVGPNRCSVILEAAVELGDKQLRAVQL